MEHLPEYIDDLIAAYLSGETSVDEMKDLERWRAENPANEAYFKELEQLYTSVDKSELLAINVDAAWKNVNAQINEEKAKVRKIEPVKKQMNWLRIAASVIIVLGLSYWFINRSGSEKQLAVNADHEIVNDTLPDGSSVIINRNSSISYAESFGKKNRTIKLKGEAYFKVNHDSENTFLVEVNGVVIRDIGTEFNIKADTIKHFVEVYVGEGEISFYKEGEPELRLLKGESAIYYESTGKIEKLIRNNPNVIAYASGDLDFKNTSLNDVAEILNGVYGTDITVTDEVKNCRITATFHKEEIQTLLLIISETLGVKVDQNDNHIKLSGNACK